ncbi:orotate phosphoribosyltransferase [Egicoccus sp. AB-alg2]|uniref:orotate phosphoribosyltransferase n=1 Tax=Egicoccus sp. AB-alg2 TaxID=3242693 RepID=UPI00359D34E9
MHERTRDFVDFMVRCDVLTFGDFVAKSGRRTPYFVNAGRYRTGTQVAELGRFYAATIDEAFGDGVDVLFGPAYKGIPLAVTTAIALAEHHDRDVGFCFDRKEAKDHGEGGSLVGHPLADGDRVVVVEDVTTAGTSIRNTLPLLRAAADVEVVGLVVGVDRRERGSRDDVSALDELAEDHGLRTVALATVDDVVEHLRDREVDGRRVLGDDDLDRIARYRAIYGVR